MFVSPTNRGLKQITLQVRKPEKGHAGDPGRPRNGREKQETKPNPGTSPRHRKKCWQ